MRHLHADRAGCRPNTSQRAGPMLGTGGNRLQFTFVTDGDGDLFAALVSGFGSSLPGPVFDSCVFGLIDF